MRLSEELLTRIHDAQSARYRKWARGHRLSTLTFLMRLRRPKPRAKRKRGLRTFQSTATWQFSYRNLSCVSNCGFRYEIRALWNALPWFHFASLRLLGTVVGTVLRFIFLVYLILVLGKNVVRTQTAVMKLSKVNLPGFSRFSNGEYGSGSKVLIEEPLKKFALTGSRTNFSIIQVLHGNSSYFHRVVGIALVVLPRWFPWLEFGMLKSDDTLGVGVANAVPKFWGHLTVAVSATG